MNVFGLSIKDKLSDPWDFNPPGEHTVFLDIKYTFHPSDGLMTDINIKSTDARVYLHFSSHHPKQTFPSIVFSQCLRYKRIINNGVLLVRRLSELKMCFLKSGYPKKMVEDIIADVLPRRRNLDYNKKSDMPPYPVMWIQTFSSESDTIKQLINKANNVIKQSPVWKDEKTNVLGLVHRRAPNLGDTVLQRKRLSLGVDTEGLGTVRCTPVPAPGIKRRKGRPCEACPLMSHNTMVKSTVSGRSFKAPPGTCKSHNLIYCAECVLCQKQYVGKTVNKLQKRISGHRSFVNKLDDLEGLDESDDAALAHHLKQDHNFDTISIRLFNVSYKFTILENNPHSLDKSEQRWVNRLVSMRPFGLNVEKPGGVTESYQSMTRKSLQNILQR